MSKHVHTPHHQFDRATSRSSLLQWSPVELDKHGMAEDELVAQTPFFDFYRVASPDRMVQVHRLRYEVYCEERGLLPIGDYPDGEEHDEFDGCSVHFLGCHRISGVGAGTARLVLASPLGLPMMSHCEMDEHHRFLSHHDDHRLLYYGEVSRVAVSKRYHQRPGDTPFGGPPRARNVHAMTRCPVRDFPTTAGPEIVAGLYKAIYQEARRLGLTHLAAAMERSLATLLRRLSIHFTPIGPERDYYGPVRPYVVPVSQMELDLLRKRPEVLRFWLDGLHRLLWPPIGHLVDATLEDRLAEACEVAASG